MMSQTRLLLLPREIPLLVCLRSQVHLGSGRNSSAVSLAPIPPNSVGSLARLKYGLLTRIAAAQDSLCQFSLVCEVRHSRRSALQAFIWPRESGCTPARMRYACVPVVRWVSPSRLLGALRHSFTLLYERTPARPWESTHGHADGALVLAEKDCCAL